VERTGVTSPDRADWPPIAERQGISVIRSIVVPHVRLATQAAPPGIAEGGLRQTHWAASLALVAHVRLAPRGEGVKVANKQNIPKTCKGMLANDNWRPPLPHEVMKADLIEAGYEHLIKALMEYYPNMSEETAVEHLHSFY
jgi:hypothetical protein